MDIVAKMNVSVGNLRYILSLIDYFSSFTVTLNLLSSQITRISTEVSMLPSAKQTDNRRVQSVLKFW